MSAKAPRQRASKGVNALIAQISVEADARSDPGDFIDQVIQGLKPLARKSAKPRRSAKDNGAATNA